MGGAMQGFKACSFGRVSGPVATVAIVLVVNAVVFLGALRVGFVFYRFPAESAGVLESDMDSPELWQVLNNQSKGISCVPLHSSSLFEYPVCLILSIGDDTSRPNYTALPYSRLYRLFDAMKAELSKVLETQTLQNRLGKEKQVAPIKLLVGVDYASVACKMARDALEDSGEEFVGVELTCQTPEEMKTESVKVAALSHADGEKNEDFKFKCGKMVVAGSSQYVTQLTLEWAQILRWGDLEVVDVDQPDPALAPPDLPREMWRPTVATAFSGNHFVVGSLLLRSLAMAGKEIAEAGHYNISVVVFALEEFNSTLQGILDCQVREMNEEYKIPTEVRQFNFSAYPSWMRINQTKNYNGGLGEYAWKVAMIHSVAVERGFVFWTDAGCRVKFESLMVSLNYTRDHGFANRRTQGQVPQYVHAGMLKYLRYVVRYTPPRVQNCDGSAIGMTLDKYPDLIRPWYECSKTRQCIAPDGSHHGNHRQDQAALTLLADMSDSPCIGVSMHLRRHMDTHLGDYSGTYPSKCYRDPLQVVAPPL